MADNNCTHCGGSTPFNAELAFARLAKRQNALVDVTSRLMDAAVVQPARGNALQPHHLSELMREYERILGGRPTTAFPECCLVGHRDTNGLIGWFCSGVLIHPQIVLTAGHCFIPENRANIVALATTDQNHLEAAELVSIRRLAVHPRYQQTKQVSDMTVIILRAQAKTAPARIATTAELVAAEQLTLVGFGNEDVNSSKGFGIKREVDVAITSMRHSPADALDHDEQVYGYESDFEFVAGGKGLDTCNGDSGGPVYIETPHGKALAGLTSRATAGAVHQCGDGGIYTRIDVHLDFISNVARDAGIDDLA